MAPRSAYLDLRFPRGNPAAAAAKDKLLYPGLWDVGAPPDNVTGEDPLTSGLREIEEEVGIRSKTGRPAVFQSSEKVQDIYRDIIKNEFYYIYFLKYDGDILALKLQAEEIPADQFPAEEMRERVWKLSRTDTCRTAIIGWQGWQARWKKNGGGKLSN